MSDKDVEEIDDHPFDPERADLLLRVSERYYSAHRSMVAIAEEFGVSRFRVARLLVEAELRGAVRVTLHRPDRAMNEDAVRLKAKYGLRQAVVVESGTLSQPQLRDALGRAGARLLAELLADGDVLGLGWGRTIEAVANAASGLARCPVVQLSGITGQPNNNSMEIARRFSALTQERAYALYAPLIVPDATTARSLRTSPGIAETFAMFREVSVALVSIGSWDPPNSLLHSYIPQSVRDHLTTAHLLSEIGGIFLDADGTVIHTALSTQTMSISAEDFAAIPTVIAVAGHTSKTRAIRAALHSGMVNALVTDSSVARSLLE